MTDQEDDLYKDDGDQYGTRCRIDQCLRGHAPNLLPLISIGITPISFPGHPLRQDVLQQVSPPAGYAVKSNARKGFHVSIVGTVVDSFGRCIHWDVTIVSIIMERFFYPSDRSPIQSGVIREPLTSGQPTFPPFIGFISPDDLVTLPSPEAWSGALPTTGGQG